MQDDEAVSEVWVYRWTTVTRAAGLERPGHDQADQFLPAESPMAMSPQTLARFDESERVTDHSAKFALASTRLMY